MDVFGNVAEIALTKLRKKMIAEKIEAYIATINEEGKLDLKEVKGPFKVIPMDEYNQIQNLLKQSMNGK